MIEGNSLVTALGTTNGSGDSALGISDMNMDGGIVGNTLNTADGRADTTLLGLGVGCPLAIITGATFVAAALGVIAGSADSTADGTALVMALGITEGCADGV